MPVTGVRVSDTAALSCADAVSWNPGDRLVNVPPSARNRDLTRGLTGPFGWLIAAVSPNGRLNSAANGTPAATLPMLLVSTGAGANGTSCWLSGAATSSGGPSLPGLPIGPSGPCGPVDSIGSHDTCGTANVATSAPLSARLIPSSANAGAWATAGTAASSECRRTAPSVRVGPGDGVLADQRRDRHAEQVYLRGQVKQRQRQQPGRLHRGRRGVRRGRRSVRRGRHASAAVALAAAGRLSVGC